MKARWKRATRSTKVCSNELKPMKLWNAAVLRRSKRLSSKKKMSVRPVSKKRNAFGLQRLKNNARKRSMHASRKKGNRRKRRP